jgi:hypothetical protein
MLKPVFVPLKLKHFNEFALGDKRSELRLYGPRWNERVCIVGRRVVLSMGYGTRLRISGVIREFHKRRAHTFGSTYQADIDSLFGPGDHWIAEIRIDLDPRPNV